MTARHWRLVVGALYPTSCGTDEGNGWQRQGGDSGVAGAREVDASSGAGRGAVDSGGTAAIGPTRQTGGSKLAGDDGAAGASGHPATTGAGGASEAGGAPSAGGTGGSSEAGAGEPGAAGDVNTAGGPRGPSRYGHVVRYRWRLPFHAGHRRQRSSAARPRRHYGRAAERPRVRGRHGSGFFRRAARQPGTAIVRTERRLQLLLGRVLPRHR